jgi:hypothetical protein
MTTFDVRPVISKEIGYDGLPLSLCWKVKRFSKTSRLADKRRGQVDEYGRQK